MQHSEHMNKQLLWFLFEAVITHIADEGRIWKTTGASARRRQVKVRNIPVQNRSCHEFTTINMVYILNVVNLIGLWRGWWYLSALKKSLSAVIIKREGLSFYSNFMRNVFPLEGGKYHLFWKSNLNPSLCFSEIQSFDNLELVFRVNAILGHTFLHWHNDIWDDVAGCRGRPCMPATRTCCGHGFRNSASQLPVKVISLPNYHL